MITANLNTLTLNETWGANHPTMHARSNFPIVGAMGTENSSAVYFELEPGDSLGRHTDSIEEVLLILAGKVEVSVGDEVGELGALELAIVPTMVPHDLRNIGEETVKVLGFFGGPNIVATFEHNWLPANSNIIDTAAIFSSAPVAAD